VTQSRGPIGVRRAGYWTEESGVCPFPLLFLSPEILQGHAQGAGQCREGPLSTVEREVERELWIMFLIMEADTTPLVRLDRSVGESPFSQDGLQAISVGAL
jgi:hypothetical protein